MISPLTRSGETWLSCSSGCPVSDGLCFLGRLASFETQQHWGRVQGESRWRLNLSGLTRLGKDETTPHSTAIFRLPSPPYTRLPPNPKASCYLSNQAGGPAPTKAHILTCSVPARRTGLSAFVILIHPQLQTQTSSPP